LSCEQADWDLFDNRILKKIPKLYAPGIVHIFMVGPFFGVNVVEYTNGLDPKHAGSCQQTARKTWAGGSSCLLTDGNPFWMV